MPSSLNAPSTPKQPRVSDTSSATRIVQHNSRVPDPYCLHLNTGPASRSVSYLRCSLLVGSRGSSHGIPRDPTGVSCDAMGSHCGIIRHTTGLHMGPRGIPRGLFRVLTWHPAGSCGITPYITSRDYEGTCGKCLGLTMMNLTGHCGSFGWSAHGISRQRSRSLDNLRNTSKFVLCAQLPLSLVPAKSLEPPLDSTRPRKHILLNLTFIA